MNFEKEIRKLARSNYWQTIYNANKENVNIQLFDNKSNLSGPQLVFLQWLQTYYSLYTDLAQKESQLLTEEVIEDDERTNAYLAYRRKKLEAEFFKYQKEKKQEELKRKHHFKHEGNVSLIDVNVGE